MKNESFESEMPDFDDAARVEEHLKKMRFQKKLCRYYFHINPTATVEYINAYRELWDSDKEAKP